MTQPKTTAEIALALYASDVGLWEWSMADGMTHSTERWVQMIGYVRGELDLSGLKWLSLVHKEDRDIVAVDALAQARASDAQQFLIEFRMRHKRGHWVWVRSRGQMLTYDDEGNPAHIVGIHYDISDHKRLDKSLQEALALTTLREDRFRKLTELSSDWFWAQDTEFRFVDFPGSLNSSKLPSRPLAGRTRWDQPALNLTEAGWEAHRAVLKAHQPFHNFEMLRVDTDGQQVWVSITGTPVFDETGAFQGYMGVGRNISEQKQAEETIRKLAFYDTLTDLPNRAHLFERLKDVMSCCRRDGQHATLLFLDLDNFKLLNDTQGHQAGDLLLQRVAQRLKDSVREVDTVARLGGDEFVVILKALGTDQAQAMVQAKSVSQKLQLALNEPYELDGYGHCCTPSIGAVLFGAADIDPNDLLKRADTAMYQAKADGRNLLRFFDPTAQASKARPAATRSVHCVS